MHWPSHANRILGALFVIAALLLGLFALQHLRKQPQQSPAPNQPPQPSSTAAPPPITAGPVTHIYAHNLRLHQGPTFRVYVQWLRGELVRAKKNETPSFDDLDSFYLNVTNGVIRANMGDICNYLNANIQTAPLRNIQFSGTGDQVKITGVFHKLIPIPVQIAGTLSTAGKSRIRIQAAKIDLLKLPMKSLLGGLHITLADLVGKNLPPGMQVQNNDIYFDTNQLLPAPHINGQLTRVSLKSPDLEAVYGDATQDMKRTEQWRNFLRLRDGTLEFGKLTMHKVDLIMIDTSQDAWFDLDLANYQAQLVNGYTRMTPQAGLQIFMPDNSSINQRASQNINLQWMKNRNIAPPADVISGEK